MGPKNSGEKNIKVSRQVEVIINRSSLSIPTQRMNGNLSKNKVLSALKDKAMIFRRSTA